MPQPAYNSRVAARTRAAAEILATAELFRDFEELGGLKDDLEAIQQAGLVAEAASVGQSQARHAGKGATAKMLAAFRALRKEHTAVLRVLHAIRGELQHAHAPETLLAGVDGILRNEAAVVVTVEEVEGGAPKRKVSRSLSQEAVRAEIVRNASALLALAEIHPRLVARRVTVERLESLRKAAGDLSETLAAQLTLKGSGQAATQAVRAAVIRQRAHWRASYRLLRALSRKDERVRALLVGTSP